MLSGKLFYIFGLVIVKVWLFDFDLDFGMNSSFLLLDLSLYFCVGWIWSKLVRYIGDKLFIVLNINRVILNLIFCFIGS